MRLCWFALAIAGLIGCPRDPVLTPPVVDAGEDRTVYAGEAVELVGTADASGDPVSIEWNQISGREVLLDGTNNTRAQFIAPQVTAAEPLVFAFRAATPAGAIGIDFITITVDLRNVPPQVSAGPAQTVTSFDRVVLAGAADDEDGEIASLLWRQIGGPAIVLTGVNAETPTFLAPEVGETVVLLFDLTATDDEGESATASTRVTVVPRVISGNIAPEVDAGPDQDTDELAMVTLAGTATDADGRLVLLGWTQLSGPEVVLSSTSAEQVEFVAPGTVATVALEFQLSATDDRGATVVDRTLVTVSPLVAPNLAPIADAGSDQKVSPATLVTLAGGGTDPDGQITAFAWRQLGGPPVVLDDLFGAAPSLTAPPAPCEIRLSFELTVTDNEGATGTDAVVVIVNPPPAPTLGLGETLDFENADGTTASGLWERGVPSSGPNRAHSGLRAWATSLESNYPNGVQAYLHLPMIDLRTAIDPTLSFRLWLRTAAGDGASLEIHDDVLGWIPLSNPFPTYQANMGTAVWTRQGYQDRYALITSSLAAWVGRQVCVRIAFRSDASGAAAGAFVDDAALHEEQSDPDADGALGIRAELVLGLDPFQADTDGDGTDDGMELADGTDPLDPAWYVGAPVLAPGSRLDFEGSRQGAATAGSLWQHGVPIDAPARAYSGSWAWATDLDADYFSEAREVLNLPRIDLRFTTDPTLSFRFWSRAPDSSDGLSVEIQQPGMDWEPLAADAPPQEGIDPEGRTVWSNAGYQSRFVLALASLAPYTGDYLRARLVFRSDAQGQSSGVVIDDVQLHEEGADPDADGIPGVLDELMSTGTDPYLTDTDGDGTFDGIEIIDQTDPLNPAWYAGAPVLLPGGIDDFESSDGGSATTGDLWQHAVVVGGPGRAHSGSWALTTRGDGNYFANAIEHLYLPRIDLTAASNPTIAFRLWIRAGAGDGVQLEVDTPTGWISIAPVLGTYDSIAGGVPSWRSQGYQSNYVLVAFVMNPYVGSVISTRLVFSSDAAGQGPGAFIDDFGVFEETADFDADGLPGVLAEISTYNTDPFVDDTDGDDEDDGPEIAAGRDPLDPAQFFGGPVLQIGTHLTFELNGGGLTPLGVPPGLPVPGSLWARGVPLSGPGVAYSGTRVWATNLEGNYFDGAREVLHLPPINLVGVIDPTLSFRLWTAAGPNDGVSLEVFLPGIGWGPVVPAFPSRDGIDAGGRPAWQNQGGPDYVFAAASLQLYTDQLARVRLVFRSDAGDNAAGAYIDDLRINLEASDPDADGLIGVIAEHGDYGTDPYQFDTDGDGIGDGAEITGGSDPLDPESP